MKAWVWLTGRSRAVLWLVILICLAGGYQFFRLPVVYLPEVPVREIRVLFDHDGLNTKKLKQKVPELLDYLRTLPGITRADYEIRRRLVNIRLVTGQKEATRLIPDVRARLDGVPADLLEELGAPQVFTPGGDAPVFKVALWGDLPLEEISALAEQDLLPAVRQVEGVAYVDQSGFIRKHALLHVWSSRTRIWSAGASLQQLAGRNPGPVTGSIKAGNVVYPLQVESDAYHPDDNDVQVLAIGKDRSLALTDLAFRGQETDRNHAVHFLNGARSVVFKIYPAQGIRLDELNNRMISLLRQFRQRHPSIRFRILENRAATVIQSMAGLWGSLAAAVLGILFIQLAFTGESRMALLTGSMLPLSLMLSAGIMKITGMSFNIISLSGLILGTGILIDNGIVVAEGISRCHRRSASVLRASRDGVIEMAGPLAGSNLTTMLVFIPMLQGEGIMARIFGEEARVLMITVVCSLLLSMLVLPLLYFRVFRNTLPVMETGTFRVIRRHLPEVSDRGRYISAGIAALFMLFTGLAGLALTALPLSQVPDYRSRHWKLETGRDTIPADTILPGTDLEWINGPPDYTLQPTFAGTTVIAYGQHSESVIKRLSGKFPDARMVPGDDPVIRMMQAGTPEVELLFTGAEASLKTFLTDIGYAGHISFQENWLFGKYKKELLQPSLPRSFTRNDISIRFTTGDSMILRANRRPVYAHDILKKYMEPVTPFIRGDVLGRVISLPYKEADSVQMNRHVRMARSAGLGVRTGGRLELVRKLKKDMITAGAWSLLILYLVLYIQFGSCWWPLVVMSVIPAGLGGGITVLYLTGQSLNIMSGIGLLAMLGVVVNDAILKVSAITRNLRKDPLQAALKKSMQQRLKPILMTTSTTLVCCLPMLFFPGTGNELQRSLALSLGGGVFVSTLAALYLIPALVIIFQGVLIRHPTGRTSA